MIHMLTPVHQYPIIGLLIGVLQFASSPVGADEAAAKPSPDAVPVEGQTRARRRGEALLQAVQVRDGLLEDP